MHSRRKNEKKVTSELQFDTTAVTVQQQQIQPQQQSEEYDYNNNKRRRSNSNVFIKSILIIIVLLALLAVILMQHRLRNALNGGGDGNLLRYKLVGATPMETTYDAIIIGAGWAGIRATQTLLSSGIDNILVLEANDYIGGRSKSINHDGSGMRSGDVTMSINNPDVVITGGKSRNKNNNFNVPYDLGSEWLYIPSTKEDFLGEQGYLDSIIDNDVYSVTALLEGHRLFYMQTRNDEGRINTERVKDSYGDGWFNDVWGGFMKFRHENLDDLEGLSYVDAINRYKKSRFDSNEDTDSLQLLDLIQSLIGVDYAGDSSHMDVSQLNYYPSEVKSHYMSVPGLGFGNVAARVAHPFLDKIQLNSKVTEINSEEFELDDISIVTYLDEEDGVEKMVKAKTVLVTVSLGVLKAGNIKFVPSLPTSKLESIDNMGFGVLNKCTLSWNDHDDLVWPEDKLWFFLITPDGNSSGEWTTFYNPSSFKGKPTLTAWVGGEDAIKAEKDTNSEIKKKVMHNLKSMFPNIREPDTVLISRWGQEENIKGAYMFPVAGRDRAQDSANLQRNVGRVYFAGEATSRDKYASTLGAWKTGEEAALAMAELLENDPRKFTTHLLATDCTASNYPRKIPTEKDWQFLQDAYHNSRNRNHPSTPRNGPRRKRSFLVPYEIRDDGPRGRSVYATKFIPKGRKIYEGFVVKVEKQSDFTNFLRLLPHNLQCDVLLWAFAGNRDTAYLVLDEGAFVNHGESPELINLDSDCRTLRDIHPGEELLQDYGDFVKPQPGWFNDIRERAWGASSYVEQGATE